MPKIKKITDAGVHIYPQTIPQAVIDPNTGESVHDFIEKNLFLESIEQTTTSTSDGGTNVITATYTNGTTSVFQIKNGLRGSSGYSGAAEDLEVIDNLVDGGSDAALSAEQGKALNAEISKMGFVLETGYYYNLTGNKPSAKAAQASTGTTVPVPTKKGQKFLLTTKGGNGGRAYAFTDVLDVIQEVAPASTDYTSEIITAPCDGHLYVNCTSGGWSAFRLIMLDESVLAYVDILNDLNGIDVPQTATSQTAGTIASNGSINEVSGYTVMEYPLTEGKVYRARTSIINTSSTAGRLLAAVYKDGVFIKGLASAAGYSCDVIFYADDTFNSIKMYNYNTGNYPQTLEVLEDNSIRAKITKLDYDVQHIDTASREVTTYDSDDLTHSYYWHIDKGVGEKAPKVMSEYETDSYACARYPVYAGTKIVLTTEGGNNAKAYALTNEERVINTVAAASISVANIELIAPEDGYLYVCCKSSGYESFALSIAHDKATKAEVELEQLAERVSSIEGGALPPYHNNPFPLNNGTLRILSIGNSFSVDATQYLQELLDGSNVDQSKLRIAVVSYSGRGFDGWIEEIEDGTINRSLTLRGGGLSLARTSGTMQQLLAQHWDIIVITQNSDASYDWSSYANTLKYISLLRRYCPNQKVHIAFQLPWSHTVSDDAVVRPGNIAACKSLAREFGIDYVIPVGMAVQNARNTSLNNESYLTRDNWHLNYGVGVYVASCCFFQSIISPVFDVPVIGNTAIHNLTASEAQNEYSVAVTSENNSLCQLCAFEACMNMFNVTEGLEPEQATE